MLCGGADELSAEMGAGTSLQGWPWELLVHVALAGIFLVLQGEWRRLKRLNQSTERKLAELQSGVAEREKLFERCLLVARGLEVTEASLGAAVAARTGTCGRSEAALLELQGSRARSRKIAAAQLRRASSKEGELAVLVSESRTSLQNKIQVLQQLVAESKASLRKSRRNEGKRQMLLDHLVKENSQLKQTVDELTQEAGEWKEREGPLHQQKDGNAPPQV